MKTFLEYTLSNNFEIFDGEKPGYLKVYFYNKIYDYQLFDPSIKQFIIDKTKSIYNHSKSANKSLAYLEKYARDVTVSIKNSVECPSCGQDFNFDMHQSGEICPNCGEDYLN